MGGGTNRYEYEFAFRVGGDCSRTGEGNSSEPWLTIRSIRGMYFVVITGDERLVVALTSRFQDVRESPLDIGYVA